jgi:hypothetical protein
MDHFINSLIRFLEEETFSSKKRERKEIPFRYGKRSRQEVSGVEKY